LIIGKKITPALTDALGILQVLIVELLNVSRII
jgi:hypothetical protein